ncbi:hypothetical protein N7478_001969 [Penicillium angulare]|uniref:uncharacterized protein n=1 Tax=Penicillium angulare TaxID=116970 RepID=UPI0025424326|nr:uncharacterized protein N7478_001969 [Penicillium angulare]KAJ5288939.1 hypothetical protein N7478_001969 [Penicillium angulare]
MAPDTTKLSSLFETIKKEFPHTISEHGWYTLTASVLITASTPTDITHLYNFLISQPEWSTHEQRKILSRRLREQMLKQWVVIGIPKVITAVFSLAQIEKLEDADLSFTRYSINSPLKMKYDTQKGKENKNFNLTSSREGVTISPEINARGRELCYSLYGEEGYNSIMASCGSFSADFTWASDNIIYGMFLSDESIINRVETSLMAISCMQCMGLQGTSKRHLNGLKNHGVSDEDIGAVISSARRIADWAGLDTAEWVTVNDL